MRLATIEEQRSMKRFLSLDKHCFQVPIYSQQPLHQMLRQTGLVFFFPRFDRVKVVTAAASCLKKILATESGSALLKKFGDSELKQLLWYLEPFRPSKKKRASLIFLCCYQQFFPVLLAKSRKLLWVSGIPLNKHAKSWNYT